MGHQPAEVDVCVCVCLAWFWLMIFKQRPKKACRLPKAACLTACLPCNKQQNKAGKAQVHAAPNVHLHKTEVFLFSWPGKSESGTI